MQDGRGPFTDDALEPLWRKTEAAKSYRSAPSNPSSQGGHHDNRGDRQQGYVEARRVLVAVDKYPAGQARILVQSLSAAPGWSKQTDAGRFKVSYAGRSKVDWRGRGKPADAVGASGLTKGGESLCGPDLHDVSTSTGVGARNRRACQAPAFSRSGVSRQRASE